MSNYSNFRLKITSPLVRFEEERGGALSGKLKWLEEEGRLHTGCIQAEESLSGIRKEIEAARPRYELLARIEQAQDIRDVYMEQRNARKQIDAGRSRLGEIGGCHPAECGFTDFRERVVGSRSERTGGI